jgi:hypothetical protein
MIKGYVNGGKWWDVRAFFFSTILVNSRKDLNKNVQKEWNDPKHVADDIFLIKVDLDKLRKENLFINSMQTAHRNHIAWEGEFSEVILKKTDI